MWFACSKRFVNYFGLPLYWLWAYGREGERGEVIPVWLHEYLEEFEATKGVIRIRQSKKDRQHNDQMKKDKRANNDLQNIHIKLKIE
jgi:hypothetical protein